MNISFYIGEAILIQLNLIQDQWLYNLAECQVTPNHFMPTANHRLGIFNVEITTL